MYARTVGDFTSVGEVGAAPGQTAIKGNAWTDSWGTNQVRVLIGLTPSFVTPVHTIYYSPQPCAACGDTEIRFNWTGSAPPQVTNTVYSVCITNRTPSPRRVLVQAGAGAAWEIISPQNVIILSSGQEWCGSYVLDGPPDGTQICAVLVDPSTGGADMLAVWGRVCGSQSITTNPPTDGVITGVIVSPPLSNRLASVFGTNVASQLSGTNPLTGQALGALLSGMADLTGGSGSASGVTGGNYTNSTGLYGSNSAAWDGSNIVSAVGHLESSLTNRLREWEGTNSWRSDADAQYQIGANALGGAWNSGGSNLFGSAIVTVRDIGHGWDNDVADSALDVRLRNLKEQVGQGAVLDKIKPSFNPWDYPGFRRICILIKRFLIWFGALFILKLVLARTDKLIRGALMLPDMGGGSQVVIAFMGVGGSTSMPAGLIRAAIYTAGFGILVPAVTAFCGDVTAWLDNPFVVDGSTTTVFGYVGDVAAESVWYVTWVWVNRICPLGVWMVQAAEYGLWYVYSLGLFTFFAGGHRFIRI